MNRGPNSPIQSFAPNTMVVYAAFMGGGAASNGTLPTNGQLTDSSGAFPKGVNFGTSLTYNASTGIYYVTLTEYIKHILFVAGMVVDSGGSPTAVLRVDPIQVKPATKRIDIKVSTPAGTLTDLGTSDMLILRIEGADTSAVG